MKQILSIQSHVAHGYVGNRAAVFPLQRMGFDVIAINTVQFSNHTGYGHWTGEVFSPDHVAAILGGLEQRGALQNVDALLTGYLGDPAVGEVILSAMPRLNKDAIWLCDPVMGDVGRGMFVREGVPDFFKSRALPAARIITPNQFELEHLSGITINTMNDVKSACTKIHAAGPDIILVTSLITDETKDDEIQMLASHKDGSHYLVATKRFPLDPAPNGAGDFTSAVFLANILNGHSLEQSLERTSASVFALFEETMKAGTRELAMIAAQNRFIL